MIVVEGSEMMRQVERGAIQAGMRSLGQYPVGAARKVVSKAQQYKGSPSTYSF